MKKMILFSLLLLIGILNKSYAQGDCLSSATSINSCGFFFAGNNAAFGDCPGSLCGCVGGSTNPSNLDNNCSTVYSGGNCGSDFAGSIENSMFWKFRPSEDCDYQLCITPANCCCAQGSGPDYMQVWIGQIDTTTGAITQYYVNDNNNSSITTGNTVCYTFPVTQADGDVVIMVDGNAGAECDINLDINQINCTDTCPVIVVGPTMSVKWKQLTGQSLSSGNVVKWSTIQSNTSYYNVQRSDDGSSFTTIATKTAKDTEELVSYTYTDNTPYADIHYYRIKEVSLNPTYSESYSKIIRIGNKLDKGVVICNYTITGREITSEELESYKGIVLQQHSTGIVTKIVK